MVISLVTKMFSISPFLHTSGATQLVVQYVSPVKSLLERQLQGKAICVCRWNSRETTAALYICLRNIKTTLGPFSLNPINSDTLNSACLCSLTCDVSPKPLMNNLYYLQVYSFPAECWLSCVSPGPSAVGEQLISAIMSPLLNIMTKQDS